MAATLLRVTADYTPASTVAWSTVTGLTIPVLAGVEYYFEFSLLVSVAATTTGHTVSVLGPASTYLRYSWTIPTSSTAVSIGGSNVYDHAVAVPATSASATATAPAETRVAGLVVPSADGTLACRVKPEVAAAMTVQRGSWGLVATP